MDAPPASSSSLLSGFAKLMFCICGIYACFLTWGILQERISTVAYPTGIESLLIDRVSVFPACYFISFYNYVFTQVHQLLLAVTKIDANDMDNSADKFSSFIFLNLSQALASWIVSSSVVYYYRRSSSSRGSCSSSSKDSSPLISSIPGHPVAPTIDSRFPAPDRRLFWLYLKLSIIYSVSSPFAYASLKYIHYVAMNLGKACKLLPLVLIKIFVKRESIERRKLFNLLLITMGVVGFLFFEAPKGDRSAHRMMDRSEISGHQALIFNFDSFSIVFGVLLLLINLFLDGLMNSMQDEVFSTYKPSPFHMMFYLNRNSTVLMVLYLFLAPWSDDLKSALKFIAIRPSILPDIFLFSTCGAVGQAIVFMTLGNFGAILLVTITVTRKLFTILLSVLYFGHSLTPGQWSSVFIVFLALILEAYLSSRRKHPLPPPIEVTPVSSPGKYKVIKPLSGKVK
ncbi:UDP-galactose transporter [Mitosporidium daphniae]|uniref:UDP-galactose transporter homolog 1 n=1 Tax=Mitosporidium daphniae TaxID=1485682 RepID=A0A098VNX5_9MICR|nr:uncharacterized protein DI09_57p30 [Mitosporidium daphniae]KGG50748.1 hypothetical protein DI09_57p30 [Mitosporidium daphniae]|eukprot:XP_013237190.1 uncharacterized protein DI09_57p30 [Mitosporidium daphniae]